MQRSIPIVLALALFACGDVGPLEERDPRVTSPDPEDKAPDQAVEEAPEPVLNEPQEPEEPVFDEPAREELTPDRDPVVILVHGFGGFAEVGPLDYFFGVAERLAETHELDVFSAPLPPVAGTEARAAALGTFVDEVLSAHESDEAILICHSQGGIDCRALVHDDEHRDHVAAIVTVAAPHEGTPLADLAAQAPEGFLNPAGLFFAALMGLAENPPTDADWQAEDLVESAQAGDVQGALDAMTTEGAAAFNAAYPDVPEVPLYSVAAVSRLSTGGELCEGGALFGPLETVDALQLPLVLPGFVIAGGVGRDSDGVVPTDSMRRGEFLGCVPADHLEEIGQPIGLSLFDHLAMYESIVDFVLAR